MKTGHAVDVCHAAEHMWDDGEHSERASGTHDLHQFHLISDRETFSWSGDHLSVQLSGATYWTAHDSTRRINNGCADGSGGGGGRDLDHQRRHRSRRCVRQPSDASMPRRRSIHPSRPSSERAAVVSAADWKAPAAAVRPSSVTEWQTLAAAGQRRQISDQLSLQLPPVYTLTVIYDRIAVPPTSSRSFSWPNKTLPSSPFDLSRSNKMIVKSDQPICFGFFRTGSVKKHRLFNWKHFLGLSIEFYKWSSNQECPKTSLHCIVICTDEISHRLVRYLSYLDP